MQDDNRETEIEIDEKVYATEKQYLEQTKRIKSLSEYDKEEIFFVRWFTFIFATVFSLVIWVLFLNLNGHMAVTIFSLNFLIPPLYYFRKPIGGYVKEKIIYWWSMINGRIP